MSVSFAPVPLSAVPWTELDTWSDRTVHQTRAWLGFLAETQRAEPVVLQVLDGQDTLGWFTGATVRRFGVRVLGSPMRGWTTAHMGFNLHDDGEVGAVTASLARHAMRSMRCWHLEVMDRRFDGPVPPGFRSTPLHGLELRLDLDDAELLGSMTPHGRRDVRRALRLGAQVEEVGADDPSFAREYYEQVSAAFGRRGSTPPYPLSRVTAMIRHLHPAGHLVLLRARLPDGRTAATGIFAGIAGGTASFTFEASDAAHHHWYPNELIVWEGLRRWRDRGALRFDLGGRDVGGAGDFKRKFGGTPHTTQWLRTSRFGAIETARSVALGAQRRRQRRGAMSASVPTHVD